MRFIIFLFDVTDCHPGAVCHKPDELQLSAWPNALAMSSWTGAVCGLPWCPFCLLVTDLTILVAAVGGIATTFAAVGQAKYFGHESRYHFSSDIAEQLEVTVFAV